MLNKLKFLLPVLTADIFGYRIIISNYNTMRIRLISIRVFQWAALSLLLIYTNTATFAQPVLSWKFTTGGAVYAAPAIAQNIIYFGSSDTHLYALDKTTGRLQWKFKTWGEIRSSPVIYKESVIFSSSDGNIYALDKRNGTLNWTFKTKGERRYDVWDYYNASPAIAANILYIGSGDSCIYAINADSGKKFWAYKTGGIVHATPVIKNNTVFTGSFDGNFYALNALNGKLVWKFKTVGDANFPKGEIQKEAIINDKTIFFGSRDYNLYALDILTGTGKWNRKEIGSWMIAQPFYDDNKIYAGTSDTHRFYALDANTGAVKWTLPLNMRVYGAATLFENKLIFGCFNGKMYFVDPQTGKISYTFQTEESKANYTKLFDDQEHLRKDVQLYGDDYLEVEKKILSLGAILSDPVTDGHTLYFGDTNGNCYALGIPAN